MTETLIQVWKQARTRFSDQLPPLSPSDLLKKLSPAPNSAGFLIRHIADVELLFAKNVFQAAEVRVVAKTVIDKRDTGQWINLEELKTYQEYAGDQLLQALNSQTSLSWNEKIVTREFGEKTRAEALGRIISHTAYHAGQLAMILKYGQP
ncbi:MAG: DinB family protein [Adhaeribacter sp.]